MEAFKTIIWIINIFSSLAIIALVLMQHGKGADAGANFGGSGSAQGVFGSGGNANFLTRMTGIAAAVFFASCLALGYVNTKSANKVGGIDFSDVQQSSQIAEPKVIQQQIASDVVAPSAASSASAVSSTSSNSAVATVVATGAAAATAKAVVDSKNKKTDSSAAKTAKSDKDKKDSKKTANTKKSSKPAEKSKTKQ